VARSLKNETYFFPSSIESSTLLHIVFEASFHLHVPLDEMKLEGKFFHPLDFMLKLSQLGAKYKPCKYVNHALGSCKHSFLWFNLV
jgi:hypothetical protein